MSILRALAVSRDNKEARDEWRRYRRHAEKNRAWILPSAVTDGVIRLGDFSALFDDELDHPELLDQVKQIGFYTDCLTKRHWSEPDEVVSEELARQLVQTAELLSKKREVSAEEIELWVEIIGPVWKGSGPWMKRALAEWHRIAVERGILTGEADAMERFIYGPGEDDA